MKIYGQQNGIYWKLIIFLTDLSHYLLNFHRIKIYKAMSLIFVMAFNFTLRSEEITILNQYFEENFKYWVNDETAKAKDFGFTTETVDNEKCLVAIGVADPEKQKGRGMRQIIRVPKDKISNKYFTFSADVKSIKNSGTLRLAIREVNRQGKTIRYHNLDIGKWAPKEWKRFLKQIHIGLKTERLEIYIKTMYLKPGDKILLKKMRFDI